MKISIEIKDRRHPFVDLSLGEVFVYNNDGIYYMKIEGEKLKKNAVSLSDGKLYDFEDFYMVNKINADLRIKTKD
jgi:hypothetical protein